MPEFIAEHVPSNLDEFTTGYLEAMEWLLQGPDGDEPDRSKIRGFTKAAIKKAKEDCADFQSSHADQLAQYEEISGRPPSHAGHDFYLSRNGHGTGFFDRGNEPVFNELQKAAKVYSSTYEDVYHGWIYST